jgi:hypothetical protein
MISTIDSKALSNFMPTPNHADHVGSSKAKALAETWRKAYPHARFEAFEMSSQRFVAEHLDLVGKASNHYLRDRRLEVQAGTEFPSTVRRQWDKYCRAIQVERYSMTLIVKAQHRL